MSPPRRFRLLRAKGLRGFREGIAALAQQMDAAPAGDRVVLVPTRSAADQLQRTLAEQRERGVRRPAIQTRAQWYRTLAARARVPARMLSLVERHVLMSAAARGAAQQHPPPFRPRPGLLPAMVRFYDELLLRRQTVDRFEQILTADLEASADIDRGARRLLAQTQFLAAAFRAYEARRTATGRCDEHSLRQQLSAAGLRRPLAGVVVTLADRAADDGGLWPADFDLLAQLDGVQRVDVVATEAVLAAGFRERLSDHLPGIEEQALDAPAASPQLLAPADAPDALHCTWRDREDELLEIAGRLRAGSNPAAAGPNAAAGGAKAVVFQRPLPYLYLARQIFPQAGLPFQARDSFPLAGEPYAAALDLVIEFVRTGFSRAAAVALLRSPHFDFSREDQPLPPAAIAALDRALLRARCDGGRRRLAVLAARWSAARADAAGEDALEAAAAPAAAAAAAAAAQLQPLAAGGPPSRLLERLAAFLRGHTPVAAALARGGGRRAVLAVLGLLARTHAALDDAPVDFEDLVASIRRLIEGRTFRPRTGAAGAHFVDARAAAYGRFQDVFLVGLLHDEWPPAPERMVFYPRSLLRELGWPSEPQRLRAARARFSDLLRLAERSVTVSTFSLEDEAPVAPSSFLDQLPAAGLVVDQVIEPAARPVTLDGQLAAGLPPAEVAAPAREWLALRQHRQPPDARHRGAAGSSRLTDYATRALEAYRACPFRYFARYELELEPEPAATVPLSAAERVRIARRLTAKFWAGWRQDGETAVTPRNYPRALQRFRSLAGAAVRAVAADERAIVRAWLFGSAAAPGLVEQLCTFELKRPAAAVERRFDLRLAWSVQAPPDGADIQLAGRLDRVELSPDGTFDAIDYRWQRSAQLDWQWRLRLQAPAAARHLAGYRGRTWSLGAAASVALGGALLDVQTAKTVTLAHETDELLAQLDRMRRGVFPVQPRTRQLCGTCAYAAVCRKQYAEES